MVAADRSSNTPRSLSLILPALNEEAAVGDQVRALLAHPAWRALPLAEIIVVDNGSDDATASVARAAGARVICEPRRGYGAACYAGLLAAQSDTLLLMDSDGSDDLADAARVARRVLAGEADLAMGSRTRGRCEKGALTPQQRVGNTVAALLMWLLYGAHVTDLGPVRAIRRDALLALDPHERGYGWSTEMLVKAARAGYRIVEEPAAYHRRAGGVSKVSGTLGGSLRAGYSILATVLRYARWRPAGTLPGASRRDALVIVAKYPRPGHVKTRLGATIGFERSARLYRAFLHDLAERFTQASQAGGYDLIWACADDPTLMASVLGAGARMIPQRGADFATRLYHICRDTAALGYERTIILGSDSPHIPAASVTHARALLERADVALGPAEDGGYYLVGVRNRPAPPDIFTGITMSTARVLAQTLERATALGLTTQMIATTFDVDTGADMLRLAQTLDAAPSLAPCTHELLQEIAARATTTVPATALAEEDTHGAG